ncbi:3-hydroxyacyl-CoA dehydrogenase [soil metagenome]
MKIGVVGTGAMGQGIIQLFAQSGNDILCFDSSAGAVPKAIEAITGLLARSVQKGKMTAEAFESVKARIQPVDSLLDLADCDLVIEAIVEKLEVKQGLFRNLETIVSDSAMLASNTSSLSISEIAAACAKPERVAGLHFFNPVPLMKVAEVIGGVRTTPAVVETLRVLVDLAGHRAVVVDDQPGFLVNHAGRGFPTEGLKILEERVATTSEIDDVLREAAGFRMGPFQLLDLTGLDVSGKVMTSIYEQFQQEPRVRPSSLVPPRVAAGLLGRKTGAGWYSYNGQDEAAASLSIPTLPAGMRFWIDPAADGAAALTALVESVGCTLADAAAANVLIIQPWGVDATSYAAANGLDSAKTVAVDPLPAFTARRTLMLTVDTSAPARDAAHALLASDGVAVTVISDSPGFIAQRVLATVVNIAANMAQRGIGSVDDIDDAVRLGLGYPQGPLTWGDKIGGANILKILNGMLSVTHDPRYRPSPWLARRVAVGASLRTAEAPRRD